MKVKFFGLTLHTGHGISFNELFTFIEKSNGVEADGRILTVKKRGDYWTGLLLTIKNWRAYCQVKKTGGQLTISARQLENETNIADFNFFAIYEPTGRGLYQYYHQSTHISTFCVLLKKRYDALKATKIKEALEAVDQKDEEAVKQINKKFAKSLTFAALCRRESLPERIARWERVKLVQFQYETLYTNGNEDALETLSRTANTRLVRFTYANENADLTKENVKAFFAENLARHIRVVGVDPQGIDDVYKQTNDYDVFAEYEFNEVINTLSVDQENLLEAVDSSQVMENILTTADTTARAILTMPTA